MVSGSSSKATLRFPRHERTWIVTNHGTSGSEKKSLNFLLKHCLSLWYVTVWSSYYCAVTVPSVPSTLFYLFCVDYAILQFTFYLIVFSCSFIISLTQGEFSSVAALVRYNVIGSKQKTKQQIL